MIGLGFSTSLLRQTVRIRLVVSPQFGCWPPLSTTYPVCHPEICNSNKTKLSFAGTGSAKQVSADLPLLQHVHQKRNDQNIVLWLGTLRHGDFSAKTSLVLQIARKSSKSYFAEAAKTSFVLWLAAKTVLFLQTNLRVAYGVTHNKGAAVSARTLLG